MHKLLEYPGVIIVGYNIICTFTIDMFVWFRVGSYALYNYILHTFIISCIQFLFLHHIFFLYYLIKGGVIFFPIMLHKPSIIHCFVMLLCNKLTSCNWIGPWHTHLSYMYLIIFRITTLNMNSKYNFPIKKMLLEQIFIKSMFDFI